MGFYRSAFQGWTVARFALCSLLLLVAVVFAGSPLVTEQASAAACRPSVAVTFSTETRVGGEAVSATVTVTANAATGGAPDTLTRIAFTGARNGEVRVQGQPVTVPRTYTLANVTSWSFQIQKL
ncbi:MAG TPA: hypothetical protein VFH48_07520 [Chloroflexota bacterium]|nr:hypothetical protein [Chloroflexota bacterium]